MSVHLESLHFRRQHSGLPRQQEITVVRFTWYPGVGYPPVSSCFAGVGIGSVSLARALRVHASSSGELSSLSTDGDDDGTVCKYTTEASSAVSGVLSLLQEVRARVVLG